MSEDDNRACQSTPREELQRQIMSACVPKNEREWWAAAEIERLTRERDEMRAEIAWRIEAAAQANRTASGWKHRVEDAERERDEMRTALRHCENVLGEYERKPGEDLRGFMLGALDSARAALAPPTDGAER